MIAFETVEIRKEDLVMSCLLMVPMLVLAVSLGEGFAVSKKLSKKILRHDP